MDLQVSKNLQNSFQSFLMDLSNKKIVIVTHRSLPLGPAYELRNYLLENNTSEVLSINHPLLNMKEFYGNTSEIELYKKGNLVFKKKAFHWLLPNFLLYFKDFLYTFFWVLRRGKRFDLFVGVDPLNAFPGILLKKLGIEKKVVYYTIDYMTPRFKNKLLNFVYHWLDKFCVRNADETWNVSGQMKTAREEYNHMKGRQYANQYTVPIGVWTSKYKPLPINKINKNKIVYVGSLRPIMGVDLLIQAMPFILKKMPDTKLEIIGGGPDEEELKNLAVSLNIKKNVIFYGWKKDRNLVGKLLSDAMIGLAPFNEGVRKDEVRNADPAKIKEYMAFGLPVITTKAVNNYQDILNTKSGLVVDYNPNKFAEAVFLMLSDKKLLQEYKNNAREYVKQFDYNKIFGENLNRILYKN